MVSNRTYAASVGRDLEIAPTVDAPVGIANSYSGAADRSSFETVNTDLITTMIGIAKMTPQKPSTTAPTITPNIMSSGSTSTALPITFGEIKELSTA